MRGRRVGYCTLAHSSNRSAGVQGLVEMKRDGCDALVMIFDLEGLHDPETQRGSDTGQTSTRSGLRVTIKTSAAKTASQPRDIEPPQYLSTDQQ